MNIQSHFFQPSARDCILGYLVLFDVHTRYVLPQVVPTWVLAFSREVNYTM